MIMTEEKIKEVVQKMIDNNEPPEKIREFVKLAKSKMQTSKEAETQVDAPVTEEDTASTSDDTSSGSLLTTETVADEEKPVVLNEQIKTPKSQEEETALDKLQKSFDAARLTDAEIQEANERGLSAVNTYYSDYDRFLRFQEEKANRVDVREKDRMNPDGSFNFAVLLEQNNAVVAAADETQRAEVTPVFDGNIHKKVRQINQNKAFSKYINDKNIDLSNLNEEELEKKRSEILNSDEFDKYLDVEEKASREYGLKIAALDQQLRAATTEEEKQSILNQIAEIEKENPLHEQVVFMQQKENRASDIEDKVIEQVDEMGFRFWSKSDEQEELIEAAAIKEKNLQDKSEGLLSKIEVLSKQSETTYNKMLTLNDWFNTTGKEYQKEMKQIASKQYTSKKDLDAAKQKIKTLQQEYSNKVNEYETLKQTGLDQSEVNKKLQAEFQDLDIEIEEFTAYSNGIKRNPGQLTSFFSNIGMSVIDLGQGIVSVADMITQIPDELIKEIDDPGVRSFLQTAYNVANPVFGDGTDGVSLWDQARDGIDKWQYEDVTSKIRKPIQFDNIDSAGDAAEWGANLLATQIPNLALMYATGGASLFFLGASSAGTKYNAMQEERDMFYKTGGLYGNNHSFGTMFLNSSFTGTTEALSERVTLGAVNKTAKILGKIDNVTLKNGYRKYLRDNVFTYKNTKSALKEFNEEGFTEVLATMGGNFADMMSGQDVNIYDGGLESYVSGGVISASIQSPRLYKALTAPFKTTDTNQKLQAIDSRIDQINQEINELTKSTDPLAAEKLEKLKEERIKLTHEHHRVQENDIKRVDLLTQEQKSELVEIDRARQDVTRRVKEIQSSELSQNEKDVLLDKLAREYIDGQKRKDQILNSIPNDAILARYDQEVEAMKAYEKKIKDRGVVDIDFVERTRQEFEDMIAQDQTGDQLKSKAQVEDFTMEAVEQLLGGKRF